MVKWKYENRTINKNEAGRATNNNNNNKKKLGKEEKTYSTKKQTGVRGGRGSVHRRWETPYSHRTERHRLGLQLGLSSQPAVRRPAREADDVSAAGGGKAYRCSLKVVSQRHRHVNVAVGSCGDRIVTLVVTVATGRRIAGRTGRIAGRRGRTGRRGRRGRRGRSGGAEVDDANKSGQQCRVRPATPEGTAAQAPLFAANQDLKGPFQIVVDPKIQFT